MMRNEPLEFAVWCDVFGDEAMIKAAESGSDREGNYDHERYMVMEYEAYCEGVK